jgi:predicted permease
VVNTVLLEPLPFPEADRIVQVERLWPDARTPSTSAPAFVFWRDQSSAFESICAYQGFPTRFNLTGGSRPEPINGYRVTRSFFSVFNVQPTLGRGFVAEEDRAGGPPVVVLGHSLWKRRFGSDVALVGQPIVLDEVSYTVVGVMPEGFTYPFYLDEAELWTPLQIDSLIDDPANLYHTTARLKEGVALEEADAEMQLVAKQYWASRGELDVQQTATVRPLQEFLYGVLRPAFLVLLAIVSFVLLVACANVANIMLSRLTIRYREIAVRKALGAGTARIVRLLLTESLLLSLAGGVAAILLCSWTMGPLLSLVPVNISVLSQVSLNWEVFALTLMVSLATGLLTAIAPVMHASGVDIAPSLQESSDRTAGRRRGRLTRRILLAGEIALTLIVVVCAALLIQTFARLRAVAPGFDTENVVTMKLPLSPRYVRPEAWAEIDRNLLPKIQGIPGVQTAGFANSLPMGMGVDFEFIIEGRYAEGGEEGIGSGQYRAVSHQFFETMGISLARGRLFDERDSDGGVDVVVINEATANAYWPDTNPIGQRIQIGPPQFTDVNRTREVVGIVKNVKESGLANDAPRILYVPMSQLPQRWTGIFVKALPLCLVVKADIESSGLVKSVEEAVWAYDPGQPVTTVRPMQSIVERSIGRQRFSMVLMGAFAGLILLLALVGVYGVLSHTVSQRAHEIGLRMALGARTRDVVKLVMKEISGVVLVGVLMGLAGAVALGRVLSSLLFGVGPHDPKTLLGAICALLLASAVAAYLPARKAASIEPIRTLKYE